MTSRSVAPILLIIAVLATGASSPSVPVLSKKDRAERIRSLPEEERRWLEEIARPIILPEEENLFLLLGQEHEREIFKEEFWKRREKPGLLHPLGPGYRTRYRELLSLADTTYDGRWQDAGRMVIAHGEPASIDRLEACQDTFRDLEIWSYRLPVGTGERSYFFYRRSPAAPRKLWDLTVPDSDVFQPGSCRRRFAELRGDCTILRGDDLCRRLHPKCPQICRIFRVWEEIEARQGTKSGGVEESGVVLAPQTVELEGLEAIAARFPGIGDPHERPIAFQAATTPAAGSPTPTPAASLTPEEIRERILRLEPKYREFLDMAAPMFRGDELSRFLLMSNPDKDAFIREFWRRRK